MEAATQQHSPFPEIREQALGGITHVGFSDESNWNNGRFRSIGLVTAPVAAYFEIESALRKLMSESNISEFKWNKLSGFKERAIAIKMCEITIKEALAKNLRTDVLIWDTEDKRHKVVGRDDVMNFERMYFHLIKVVCRNRWPDGGIWRLHPDENNSINWSNLEKIIQRVSRGVEIRDPSLLDAGRRSVRREYFRLVEIQEVDSFKCPLVQLADLFAGVAAFSWDKFSDYQIWLKYPDDQYSSLIHFDSELAAKFKSRCQFLHDFQNLCKNNKLQVGLKSSHGLHTRNPRNPLNFWIYRPQHSEDRAPTRHQK